MNPKQCEWSILDQVTSVCGILLEVDWKHCLQTFYETIRVKIYCKDISKILEERTFGITGKFYKFAIEVEVPTDQDEEEGVEKPEDPIRQSGMETASVKDT